MSKLTGAEGMGTLAGCYVFIKAYYQQQNLTILRFFLINSSKEHIFIMTLTHSMQIFGEILFVKPQNDT